MTYRSVSDVIDHADDPMRTALVSMGGVRGSVAVAFEKCIEPELLRTPSMMGNVHAAMASDPVLASLDIETYLPLDSVSRGIDYWSLGQHLDDDEVASDLGFYLYDDGHVSLSMATRYAPESGADVLSATDLLRFAHAAEVAVGVPPDTRYVNVHLVVNGGAAGVSLDGASAAAKRPRSIPMGHQATQSRLAVPASPYLSGAIVATVAGAFGWTPEESATLDAD